MKLKRKILSLVATLSLMAATIAPMPVLHAEDAANPGETGEANESAGATASSLDEYQEIAKNSNLKLMANLATGEVAVQDLSTGKIWYTNPPAADEDGVAAGTNKALLKSQISINYTTAKSQVMTATSFMNSVSKKGLTSKVENGSVIFVYQFVKEEIRIPLKYSLTETALQVELLTREVEEYGTNKLNTVDILPYFGAGGSEDEGYIFVPDGSGALIPIGSPFWNWGEMYVRIIENILGGGWDELSYKNSGKAVNYWWGMSSGVIDVRVTENCPDSMAELVDILKRGISSGLIMPFHRKITAQSGGAINDGTRWLSPDELLHMDWLCSCVEGSIPGFDELLPMAQSLVRLLGVYRDWIIPDKGEVQV